MQELTLNLQKDSYQITIGESFFHQIPNLINEMFSYKKVAIITDDNVEKIYLEPLMKAFNSLDYQISAYIVPHGEASKSLAELEKIYGHLIENNVTRKDLVLALGGGVVGDLAGYAAASYLRGVDYIQIPTTLLSQVDSSVGGKVAVNLPQGKNLVGSFYHPKAVYIDTNVLTTLPHREIKSGIAEVIKYAFIKDKSLFDLLNTLDYDSLDKHIASIIKTCIMIKADVVEADERENHYRMLLNFGHTFGHGIEKKYQYDLYNHGEAVGHGMYMMIKGLFNKKRINIDLYEASLELLNKYGLILDIELDPDELIAYIRNDKKAENNEINVILIDDIGHAYIEKVGFEWLKEIMEDLC